MVVRHGSLHLCVSHPMSVMLGAATERLEPRKIVAVVVGEVCWCSLGASPSAVGSGLFLTEQRLVLTACICM